MQHVKFSPAPEYLAKLKIAIRAAHGCEAEHESTWMGAVQAGASLWSGSVEIFRLPVGAPASHAYAWSKVEGGQLHCMIVLESDEVDSAQSAVRHVLASQVPDLAMAA